MMLSGTFQILPGLPPDGAPGRWLGFDETGAVYVLSYDQRLEIWIGCGLQDDELYGRKPHAFSAEQGMVDFIKHHCAVPGA